MSNVLQVTLNPGTVMADGTIYVGLSPNNGRPLYAMPADLPGRHDWEGAQRCASEQTFGGHKDWRLPTTEEIEVLHRHRDTIGGFANGCYWCETEHGKNYAWSQSFRNGGHYISHKSIDDKARCVRSG